MSNKIKRGYLLPAMYGPTMNPAPKKKFKIPDALRKLSEPTSSMMYGVK
jgi:hypothetical protein